MAGAEHWNDRYRRTASTSVSWYEKAPVVSLELLDVLHVSAVESVIDIGGGASTFVDHLLCRGHREVAVLDLSKVALDEARARVGEPESVSWIETDLLEWQPPRQWHVWHDRAVLHFLTSDDDRASYVEVMRRAGTPGGAFVIGAFAKDGPTECSSLPVRRQSPAELVELLGNVEVIDQRRHVHHTPGGTDQPFTWVAGRMR